MTNDLIVKGKRIEEMNSRREATQTINPLTGKQYLAYEKPKSSRLEDPIQASLRAMEYRNPSLNKHKQGLLKNIADRLSLIDRSLRYKEVDYIPKNFNYIPKNFKLYEYNKYIDDKNYKDSLEEKIIKYHTNKQK